jgi:hypothetical protein
MDNLEYTNYLTEKINKSSMNDSEYSDYVIKKLNKRSSKCFYCGEIFIQNLEECRQHVENCKKGRERKCILPCCGRGGFCSNSTEAKNVHVAVLTNKHELQPYCNNCLDSTISDKYLLVCW